MDFEVILKFTRENLLEINKLECQICFDLAENVTKLDCTHLFCLKCIQNFNVKNTKPICYVCKEGTNKPFKITESLNSAVKCTEDLIRNFQKFTKMNLWPLYSSEAPSDICNYFNPNTKEITFEEKYIIKMQKIKSKTPRKASLNRSNTSESDKEGSDIIPMTAEEIPSKKIRKTRNSNPIGDKKLNLKNKKSSELKKNDSGSKFKPLKTKLKNPNVSSDSTRIVQWLSDTKNAFQRVTQTQNLTSDLSHISPTEEIYKMPSASQVDTKIKKKLPTTVGRIYKTRSLMTIDKIPKEKEKPRFSLDQQKINQIKSQETFTPSFVRKDIIEMMESECLNVIEKDTKSATKANSSWNKSFKSNEKTLKKLNVTVEKNPIVDAKNMEDYFTKMMPKVMTENVVLEDSNATANTASILKDKKISSHSKSMEVDTKNPVEKDLSVPPVNKNDTETSTDISDFYSSRTQPVSKVQAEKTELESVQSLFKKLNESLNSLNLDEGGEIKKIINCMKADVKNLNRLLKSSDGKNKENLNKSESVNNKEPEDEVKNTQIESEILSVSMPLREKTNRKLNFETEIDELKLCFQRSEDESERFRKVQKNQFVLSDISIAFESETNAKIMEMSLLCKENVVPIKSADSLLKADKLPVKEPVKSNILSSNTMPSETEEYMMEVCDVLPEERQIKTQDLLKHCDDLIARTNAKLGFPKPPKKNLETRKSFEEIAKKSEAVVQKNDPVCCDELISMATNKLRAADSANKFTESLFGSLHDKSNEQIVALDDSLDDDIMANVDLPSELKRKNSATDEMSCKKIKVDVSEDSLSKPADSKIVRKHSWDSDDEIFGDIIEGTPQKEPTKFSWSHSQMQPRENVSSKPIEDVSSIEIVPPPPGFNDEPKETENKPKSTFDQEVSLSQHFDPFSPIRNVIEIAQQSKHSPLTVLRSPEKPNLLTSTPKQRSILNYLKKKPCIAYSRLSKSEIAYVQSLVNKNLATFSPKFNKMVTHLVVTADANYRVSNHTMKFISAIAAGIWVVRTEWVKMCIERNEIIDEEPFEVSDLSGTPSPKISRLTRLTNPLFQGFKFHVVPPIVQTTVEEVEDVIKSLSGIVVSKLDDLIERTNCCCLIITEMTSSSSELIYTEWLERYRTATVDINWLSLSVSRYKLLSIRPYVLCAEDGLEELGYPSVLLHDVPLTCSQNETV